MRKETFSLPVYSTEDYDIFTTLAGNRDIYPLHVRRLERVIEKDPEFTRKNPLKVNKDLEIIDGQHRLAAFRSYQDKKGKAHPVYYIVMADGTLADAQAMNAGSKKWTPVDYAKAYATGGNLHYKTYMEMNKKFPGIPHMVLTEYLSGDKGASTREFNFGGFKVNDLKNGLDKLKKLEEVASFISSARYKEGIGQAFGIAFKSLINSRLYDHDRMLEQMAKFKDAINGIPNRVGELRVALNMIYNFRNPQKVDLLAEERPIGIVSN